MTYDLQPVSEKPGYVRLGIKYLADTNSSFCVVRYRIYFFNRLCIFNGHLFSPISHRLSDEPQDILYLQEIPEALKKCLSAASRSKYSTAMKIFFPGHSCFSKI